VSRARRNMSEANSALQNRDPVLLPHGPLPWVPALRSSVKDAAPRPGHDDGSYPAGTGSAVTDLIFSIAKREVTFFSETTPISFL
jgi:hypothetical protein